MFNLGMGEITVILLLALIFLGPKKLPELASGLGKLIREIRKTTSDVKNEIQLDDVIRKPMEELREAMTLHPDELKRRDRMKREIEELARQAEAMQQNQDAQAATTGAAESSTAAQETQQEAQPDAQPAPNSAPHPDQTLVDVNAAADPAAGAKTPAPVPAVPGIPGAAPVGTVAREPGTPAAAAGAGSSGHHAPPPAPPLAAVLARGSGPHSTEKKPTAAGTDFLRSLRAVPDGRRMTPAKPNPTLESLGAADRSNTTQTLTEADLAAITVGGPPPPPAPTGHTGKTQPPPPPAARLPGATPPKAPSS